MGCHREIIKQRILDIAQDCSGLFIIIYLITGTCSLAPGGIYS